MRTTKLEINGMGCSGCVNSVQQSLLALPGVKEANVSLDEHSALVTFDDNEANESDLKKAVEEAGYQITGFQS